MLYKRTFINGDCFYEIISETVTHVYLRNIETRNRWNIDKSTFKRLYKEVIT